MTLFELTRALVDIPSVTEDERAMAEFLEQYLAQLAAGTGGVVERIPIAQDRWNVFARWGTPNVTLSTHTDVVPPWFASSEDETRIWGRGACDAKGIIAAMIFAAVELLREGHRDFALLFVAGEERNSAGAYAAAECPRGSRYLINGEPTENKLALASKGSLRYELTARGRMAHSAYPELGDSAIEKLLNALEAIRRLPLASDELLGPSTMNIGTIAGGRAPNVIADEARAELLVRLVDDGAGTRAAVERAAALAGVEAKQVLCVPAVRLASLPGFETEVVAFTTDIPAFDGSWGKPLLIGPGSIHVAHTPGEYVAKEQLLGAVGIYKELVVRLS
ncbi:MAG: M20/M25/M40 family metallo-hydrolase [Acidobacteria bacterium]|nr:M20/M25/M40 family metallo-hydrolase [Acidobacteriota bacterium]